MNTDGGGFDSARGESALGGGRDWGRVTVWLAGLLVAAGAIAATAHGLFEVARAASVPGGIGWLYPVITDGLALVAYVATTRLSGHGRSYAWSVVVLAASLSGLAQASFLAGGVAEASTVLRFGVGAWPAIAAALAAHLLFLLAHSRPVAAAAVPPELLPVERREAFPSGTQQGVERAGRVPVGHRECPTGEVSQVGVPAVPADVSSGVPAVPVGHPPDTTLDQVPAGSVSQVERRAGLRPALSPADRALAIAELHRRRAGELPTVRELASGAGVGRGTADRALRELREHPPTLRLLGEPSVSAVPDFDQQENS